MTDDKEGASRFDDPQCVSAKLQGVVHMFDRLEAGDETKFLGCVIGRSEWTQANERADVRLRRLYRRSRRFHACHIVESSGLQLFEKSPVARANIECSIAMGHICHMSLEIVAVGSGCILRFI